MKKTNVELMIKESYLAMIKNSQNSEMFKNLWAKVDGEVQDITQNGNLSCAFYVSSVLYLFKLISNIHATVDGTLKDLEKSGWTEIANPQIGSVLVWAEKDFGLGEKHKHIGFYLGNDMAISNSSQKGQPIEHKFQKYDDRKIEKILGHQILNS